MRFYGCRPEGKSREETGTTKPSRASPAGSDPSQTSAPPAGPTSSIQLPSQYGRPQEPHLAHVAPLYDAPGSSQQRQQDQPLPFQSPKSIAKARTATVPSVRNDKQTTAETVLHGRVNDNGLVHHQDETRTKFIGALSNQVSANGCLQQTAKGLTEPAEFYQMAGSRLWLTKKARIPLPLCGGRC